METSAKKYRRNLSRRSNFAESDQRSMQMLIFRTEMMDVDQVHFAGHMPHVRYCCYRIFMQLRVREEDRGELCLFKID